MLNGPAREGGFSHGLYAPAAFLAGLFWLSLGCASAGFEEGGAKQQPSSDTPVITRVENQSRWPVQVFVIAGGQRRPIGSMGNFSIASFKVPSEIVQAHSTIRLLADPTGPGYVFGSDDVSVRPGDVVYWYLHPDPDLSTIEVRRG